MGIFDKNDNRVYLTYAEKARLRKATRIIKNEMDRDVESEIQSGMLILDLPGSIRKLLMKSLWILLPIYDLIIMYLFYKLMIGLNSIFNYTEPLSDFFNDPFSSSSIGYIMYLVIYGLPALYLIIEGISFIFHFIKDIAYILKVLFVNNSENEVKEEPKTELKNLEDLDKISISFKESEELKSTKSQLKDPDLSGDLFKPNTTKY